VKWELFCRPDLPNCQEDQTALVILIDCACCSRGSDMSSTAHIGLITKNVKKKRHLAGSPSHQPYKDLIHLTKL